MLYRERNSLKIDTFEEPTTQAEMPTYTFRNRQPIRNRLACLEFEQPTQTSIPKVNILIFAQEK